MVLSDCRTTVIGRADQLVAVLGDLTSSTATASARSLTSAMFSVLIGEDKKEIECRSNQGNDTLCTTLC